MWATNHRIKIAAVRRTASRGLPLADFSFYSSRNQFSTLHDFILLDRAEEKFSIHHPDFLFELFDSDLQLLNLLPQLDGLCTYSNRVVNFLTTWHIYSQRNWSWLSSTNFYILSVCIFYRKRWMAFVMAASNGALLDLVASWSSINFINYSHHVAWAVKIGTYFNIWWFGLNRIYFTSVNWVLNQFMRVCARNWALEIAHVTVNDTKYHAEFKRLRYLSFRFCWRNADSKEIEDKIVVGGQRLKFGWTNATVNRELRHSMPLDFKCSVEYQEQLAPTKR